MGIILILSLLYANKTEIGNFIVYHKGDLNSEIGKRLVAVGGLVKDSEFYQPKTQIDLFINNLKGKGIGCFKNI